MDVHPLAKTARSVSSQTADLARMCEQAVIREQVYLAALRAILDMVSGEVPTYEAELPAGMSPMGVAHAVSKRLGFGEASES